MRECPCCGHSRTYAVHIAAAPEHRHCDVCHHLYQVERQQACRYDAQYVAEKLAYPPTSAYLRLGFVLGAVSPTRDLPPLKIADVGYGRGEFLHAAAKLGHEVRGVEVHGLDFGIENVSLAEAIAWADVLTFFDSLEHLDSFEALLAPGPKPSHVFVSVPRLPPVAHWKALGEWKHFKPHEHLHYFSPTSVYMLAERAGFSVSTWTHVEDCLRGPLTWPPGSTQRVPNILTAHLVRP